MTMLRPHNMNEYKRWSGMANLLNILASLYILRTENECITNFVSLFSRNF